MCKSCTTSADLVWVHKDTFAAHQQEMLYWKCVVLVLCKQAHTTTVTGGAAPSSYVVSMLEMSVLFVHWSDSCIQVAGF